MNKILYILGLAMLLIPVGFRLMDGKQQEETIATYVKEVEKVDEREVRHQRELAEQYNQMLYEDKVVDLDAYEARLNLFENGMMGSLEIPKIDLKLPIYHGTEEATLAVGIGHLKESSLPVGGENTHSVLTGHRGVPNAQLFTRLDELEIDDVFFINVCQETLCYRVCEIQVVEPEDAGVIAIKESEDLVSLITCTPYGLNTHRLVVTGKREPESTEVLTHTEAEKLSKWDKAYLAIPCLFGVAAIIKVRRKKRSESMKKYMALILAALSMICPMQTFAATGNMKVQLPVDAAEAVSCAKVGTMVNGVFVLEEAYEESKVNLNELKTAGELSEAAGILMEYEKSGSIYPLDEEGTALLQNLEEGVYLIHGYGKTNKDISPALVFLPTWMEEEEDLLYDITVVPKYSEPAPDTGNRSLEWMYGGLLAASALILAGIVRGKSGRHKRKR